MPNLIIPMYSMRSYIDGRYSILKDGNWKLQISRMDWETDYLVVPDNSSDLDEFLAMNLVPIERLVFLKFGKNAYETRQMFWLENQETVDRFSDIDGIITDITGYTGSHRLQNNFNITMDPDYPRWYIDEFFNTDLNSIQRAEMTYVLNDQQKDIIVHANSSFKNKVTVSRCVIRSDYYLRAGVKPPKRDSYPPYDIFFPFRISDPAYKFNEVVRTSNRILITDPNDSYDQEYVNVQKKKFTKSEYYGMLATRPSIIYHEDPSRVFHPGLADFLFFGCDIITPYRLPDLSEVLIDPETQTPFYRWT